MFFLTVAPLFKSVCRPLQIDDYSMVRFLPFDRSDDESINIALQHIDAAIQYGEDLEFKEPKVKVQSPPPPPVSESKTTKAVRHMVREPPCPPSETHLKFFKSLKSHKIGHFKCAGAPGGRDGQTVARETDTPFSHVINVSYNMASWLLK